MNASNPPPQAGAARIRRPGLKRLPLTLLFLTATAVRLFALLPQSPVVSNIPDQTIAQDGTTGPIAFTVTDQDTPSANINVSASSDNTALVNVDSFSIVRSRVAGSWSIAVTPVKGKSGKATVTVTASDGARQGTDLFVLTVNPPNTPPTISDIPNQTIPEGGSTGPIPFTVGDAQTAPGQLTVRTSSDNPKLVGDNNMVLGGTTASRTLTVTPIPGVAGIATVTVTVTDGFLGTNDTFTVVVQSLDFGDAPDTYRTKFASDGARHVRAAGFSLGKLIDTEADGQATADASGDDVSPAGADDEDGVVLPASMVVGTSVTFTVEASAVGKLDAWMDFNGDGDFADAGERFLTAVALVAGVNNLSVAVPAAAKVGTSFARFRFSRQGVKDYFGLEPDGEVEDYRIQFAAPPPVLDFGDAPDTYRTKLAVDGPRHAILQGFNLGKIVDSESDGQPTADATGDDALGAGGDDEDGVVLPASLTAGTSVAFTVEATAAGRLDAWMDFNGDGDFADAGERIFTATALAAGINNLSVAVPAAAKVGVTFARFRLTRQGVADFFGAAPDGEVEDYRIQIAAAPPTLDFGDAPDTYRTKLAVDGPRHTILAGFNLGKLVDAEFEGQPTADATGDDGAVAASDDEDGVVLPASLTAGTSVNFTVEATAAGRLDAWMDFNGDGDFADAGERIFTATALAAGINNLSVAVPVAAKVGVTFARFRLTRQGVADFFGAAPDGEVEDYRIQIAAAPPTLDFGDAPDTYRTKLGVDGARHTILKGFNLGKLVDAEVDGQPTADATGDDGAVAASDDEDGVVLPASLVAGNTVAISVEATAAGRLDAWLDFNGDGDFADAGEKIFASVVLAAGVNNLNLTVPADARVGTTFARFRLSREGVVNFFGPAVDGEVEDYRVQIAAPDVKFDFGDAPDPTFPTTLKNNGARHRFNPDVFLGLRVDTEADGQPNASATGDDNNPTNANDEDGVTFTNPVTIGSAAVVSVRASTSGRLSAWIDFNGDGDWADAGEQIFNAVAIVGGPNTLTFNVPPGSFEGAVFSRFRFSLTAVTLFTGEAGDGEVEDHIVRLAAAAPILDFGDAPDTYRTKLGADGARHLVVKGFSLGKLIDAEQDGQPSTGATGDDLNPSTADDEDGVTLPASAIAGQSVAFTVEATAVGRLDAWVDFNGDGDFADAGERIFSSVVLAAGVNTLNLSVPATAQPGSPYARFRFSKDGVKDYFGGAPDGEVEDYQLRITAPQVTVDFGDAPDTYGTKLGVDGARHTVLKGFNLGKLIDAEPDGQPSSDALGDDGPPTVGDDEDGVVLPPNLVAGQAASITVEATSAGRLDAWVDFNADGDFGDAGEKVFAAVALNAGINPLVINVPSTAKVGPSFARFRLSREGGLGPTGPASDGEVEDYSVRVASPTVALDFGDAPDPTYPTTLKNNGARHRVNPDVFLGLRIDAEADGQPNAGATGDDSSPANGFDDEDGVTLSLPLVAGQTGQVIVRASTQGRLWAWVDFNADGDWADADERIFNDQPLVAGSNTLTFTVPISAKPGPSFSRFRFTRGTIESYTGEAPDGEVEDYSVRIALPQNNLDYGDAPEEGTTFPTTTARNGAYHLIEPGFRLGAAEDAEPNGQPNGTASGDDSIPSSGPDDEDGVRFLTPLIVGAQAKIEVTTSTRGRLDAWIDFNLNRSWNDPGEKIFNAEQLGAGVNVLTFNVPASLRPGVSFARFRFSLQGGLGPDGFGGVGEVEDYPVRFDRRTPCDLGCDGVDFWVAFPGNYAPDPANPVKPQLTFIGPAGTQVTIQVAGIGFNSAVVIPAAGTLTVALPKTADLGDANDVIEKKGVHITANNPITVHALSQVKYTSDGFTALSTEVLGTEYLVLGYGNLHTAVPELNGSQFAVVGTENSTKVTIIPSVVTGVHDSGFPYNIELQAGETYQLRNTNDAPRDLTGTVILSDKPVAVFGGHQVANVQSKNAFFADNLVEEMLPVHRWGTDFFTRPLGIPTPPGTRAGYTVRVLAAHDNTHVFVNGLPVGTLNRGEHLDRLLGVAARILTDRPVLVAQYAHSSDFDGVVNSDPTMVLAQQRNLFNRDIRFSTAPNGFLTHHINVIIPNTALGTVQLDGAPFAAPAFPIGASGYSHATLQVAAGIHRVTAAQPVGVIVYGWNEYDAYAWPACPFFGDTTPPEVTCPQEEIKVTLGVGSAAGNIPCKAAVPDLRSQAKATDNCGFPAGSTGAIPITQDPPPGTLVGVGTHEIVLTAYDAQGNAGTCIVKFTVIDPNPNGPLTLQCPKDMTVACTETNGAIVNYEAVALRGCTPVPLQCTPPPGSFFPVGTTTVTCVLNDPDNPMSCTFTVTVKCAGPTVVITPAGNGNLTLNFGPNAVLESAENIQGPWSAVEGAVAPFNVVPQGSRKFFRVRE